jgi:hypothetical protein
MDFENKNYILYILIKNKRKNYLYVLDMNNRNVVVNIAI